MSIIQNFRPKFKFFQKNHFKILIIFLIVVAFAYSFIAVTLHNRFMTFGLDLGYFDEAIWKVSRGKFPYSGVGCIWLLEDHFQPILYLLAPLYWIVNDARVLLVFQSFIMVFAALPLYLLAKKVVTSTIFSFAVVIAYLFFIGTQFSILNEFHQVTIAPVFIGLTFYALAVRNIRLYVFGILGLFLIKEDLSLLVVAIGLGLIFKKGYRILGIIISLVGILFFAFLIYFFLPAISVKGVYSHLDFGQAGYTPTDVIAKLVQDPIFFIRSMIAPTIKLKTIFQSLFTFGFVPILAPITYLVPLVEDFVARFIYSGGQFTKWALVNHHAAPSSMLLAISAIYGVVRIRNIIKNKYLKIRFFNLAASLIILTTVINNIIFHGPINSLFKRQFYEEEEWVRDTREVIAKVPRDVSVAAQNNLLPHLTHRDDIYRIPYGLNSQYMVVDLHDGPNKYAPLTYREMIDFVHNLLTTKRYSIVYQKGKSMLLKRNFKTDITKSKYYGNTNFCYYSYEER